MQHGKDPSYNQLLEQVSTFISTPSAADDVAVSQVFTNAMFDQLELKMKTVGWTGVEYGKSAH